MTGNFILYDAIMNAIEDWAVKHKIMHPYSKSDKIEIAEMQRILLDCSFDGVTENNYSNEVVEYFEDIPVGQVFTYAGTPFIKISEPEYSTLLRVYKLNALSSVNGLKFAFRPDILCKVKKDD